MPQGFIKWYCIFILPSVLTVVCNLIDRLRHKNKKSVRNSFVLMVVCFLGSLVALFGALSNGLSYFYEHDSELWFVVMMSVCYFVLVIALIIIHSERIIYSENNGKISAYKGFKRKNFNVSDITRIYLSDEYLDIYLGKERIRYGINFLKGEDEFEKFVKDNFSAGNEKSPKK